MAVKVNKPLENWDITIEQEKIVECNCSICMRGAYVWIYLPKGQSTVEGSENLSYYVFNNAILRKAFCKRCGVHLFNERNPLSGMLARDTHTQKKKKEQQALRSSLNWDIVVLLADLICNALRIDEKVDALSDYHKAWWNRVQHRRNINIRCLNDFDCSKVETRKLNGYDLIQPPYQNP